MNAQKEELFRNYLDGELPGKKERKILHLIADDEELRSLLRFEIKLRHSFRGGRDPSSFEVPEGFSDRVMKQITRSAPVAETSKQAEEHSTWVEWLWRPRPIQWRPAYTMVLLLVLAVLLVVPPYLGQQQSPDRELASGQTVREISASVDQVWTRFVYIDETARSVAVAGDFNDWEPQPLTKEQVNGKTVWTGLVSMNRGEHRYMFVKNGEQWVTDPLAPMHREDGFGNKNAVIYL
ncbi:hypothetical protein ACG2F4_12175 [Halalkalibaculum sp. DA3122]|uniref:hypothetical protein n=1 Tax=Halalkalibaculum sp. DA3122 TaxID=3373607 RepID=UPI0037546F0B